MTRSQRVRAEKAMERAADDMDKWEAKKKKSIEKAATIKERAKLWEDVNGESVKGKKSAFSVLAEEGEAGKKRVWGDAEMGDVQGAEVPEDKGGEVSSVAAPVVEDELL